MSIASAKSESCIGLLPAAGKGTRLGVPFPKELFPIIINNQYKPVSQFSLDYLKKADVNQITFVINETKDELISFFGNGSKFECNINYVVQEPWESASEAKSPGLAHALDSAYHLAKEKYVFFSMPDTIMVPNNVFSVAKESTPENTDVQLILFPTNSPEKYGMVSLDNGNKVLKIIDKPQKTNLNYMWGAIIWSPRFTEFLHNEVIHKNQGDFAEIINSAILSHLNLNCHIIENGRYFDIGTPDEVIDVYKFMNQLN